ncbi:MAG: prepilin-type N-terminal cleavage/methylation domain-containing protein [Verrucomicrobia bacterium]|nr:MAG: prepilin-type N-terminal cleavage/methylation domain-containing protein [Verrucomicrobiota bacterium]
MRHARLSTLGWSSLKQGFTLLEILLVLMLIALVGSVMIGGAASLLNSANEQDAESALLTLFQEVRKAAVETGQMIELEQLPEGEGFTWGASGVETLPVVEGGAKVRLIRPTFSGASLIGGQLQEEAMGKVRFYPDGSCDPVRVEVRRGETRHVLVIDPWTAAPLPKDAPSS